jgi:hypothetical protein
MGSSRKSREVATKYCRKVKVSEYRSLRCRQLVALAK